MYCSGPCFILSSLPSVGSSARVVIGLEDLAFHAFGALVQLEKQKRARIQHMLRASTPLALASRRTSDKATENNLEGSGFAGT